VEGTPFGRYRRIELLGRGGMGEEWRGHHTATSNGTVAIKLLPQLAANHSAEASHEFAKNPPRCPLQPLPSPATTTGSSEGLRSSEIHQSELRRR
jgi:hypothetical protein